MLDHEDEAAAGLGGAGGLRSMFSILLKSQICPKGGVVCKVTCIEEEVGRTRTLLSAFILKKCRKAAILKISVLSQASRS